MNKFIKESLKWFVIITLVCVGLIVVVVWYFFYHWDQSDKKSSQKISSAYSRLQLPADLTYLSKEEGNEELAVVWRYRYSSADSIPATYNNLMQQLQGQGFVIENENNSENSFDATSRSNGIWLAVGVNNVNDKVEVNISAYENHE